MLSNTYSEDTPNKASLIINQQFNKILLVGKELGGELVKLVTASPALSTFDFKGNANMAEIAIRCKYQRTLEYIDALLNELNIKQYNDVTDMLKADLANEGAPVVNVYGFKINDNLYNMDLGFEVVIRDDVTIYLDFGFITKDAYGRYCYGYDKLSKQAINTVNRKFMTKSSDKVFFTKAVNNLIVKLIPNLDVTSVSFLSNMSCVIPEVYSSHPDDTLVFLEPSDYGLKIATTLCISSGQELAAALRKMASSNLARVATGVGGTLGADWSIAKAKQANIIASQGYFGLVETQVTDKPRLQFELGEYLIRFKKESQVGWPSQSNSDKLVITAEMLANTVGQHRLIKAEALSEVLDDLLGLQWNFNRIAQDAATYVKNEANEVIGALPCLTTVLPIYKTTDIAYAAPFKLVAIDNIASKATLSKASAELASVEGFEESITNEILNLTAELAAIDLSDINSRISELDDLVAKNYRALSEALAAQALLQAKAKVYLDQIAAILKFPIKEAYSALNLGTLGEYTSLEEDDAQRTIITFTKPRWFGMRRQTQRQCCKDWVVLKSDSDNGSTGYYFIGEYYSYLINDLKGNILGGEYRNFVKTDEQTRGYGESKQVVVPYTTVGSRKVMHWTSLSSKLHSILDSLYNNDEMMANKKAAEIVRLIVQGMDNLKEIRQPIIEQLREYMEKAEKIMMLEHSLKLYYSKYKDGSVISIPSNVKYSETEGEELDAYVGMTAYDKEYANSVLRQITVDDKEYIMDTSLSSKVDELSNLIADSKLEAAKLNDIIEKGELEVDNPDKSKIKEVELKFDEITKSFGEQSITHTILAENEDEIKERYNAILVSIRKELDAIQKEDVTLRFNGGLVEIVWEEEIDSIKSGTFSVLGDDSNPKVIFNVTVDRTVKDTIQTTVTWQPAAFGKYKDEDDKICIGTLVYDLETLLKHYMIFKSLPYSDTIIKTIKYKLTGSTDASTADCLQACRQRYGTEIAYYLGSYLSKQPSKAAIVGQLVFAAVGNQELLRIELAAYAEESVMTSILKDGYDAGFAVAYDFVSSDLSI